MNTEREIIVYGLASSENGRLRYIGQTVNQLKKRINGHICYANKYGKSAIQKWIVSVLDKGFEIIGWIICPKAIWNITEIETIKQYRELGFDLLNLTDGGEGTLGYHHKGRKRPDLAERNRQNTGIKRGKMSPEENERLQQYRKRAKPYVAERNRNTKPWLGKKHTPEQLEKMRQRNLGKTLTEECKKKIGDANRGRKFTDETRRKMSESQKKRWTRFHEEIHP